MKNAKFNTKKEYLAYRSEWKAEYKKLSQQIREFKAEVRGVSCRNITWQEALRLWKMKKKATEMLIERKESKIEAQRQYLAAQAVETVAAI